MLTAGSEHRLKMSAGLALSMLLHVALVLIVLNSNASFGAFERLPVLIVQWVDDTGDTLDARAPNAPAADTSIRERAQADAKSDSITEQTDASLAATLTGSRFDPAAIEPPLAALEVEQVASIELPPIDQPSLLSPQPEQQKIREPRKVEITPTQQVAIEQRVLAATQALHDGQTAQMSWNEDGKTYQATLNRNPALGSMDLEQVTVDITATDGGARMHTRLTMNRLAFSQFSQVIDRWDPQVQMHDDEIVGRFHSNSSFAIGTGTSTLPKFAGKVTTAARGFRTPGGGLRKRAEVFQGGFEGSAGRIDLPKQSQPFTVAPADDGEVHHFADDTHIEFFADGRFGWQGRRDDAARFGQYPDDRPTYFIAAASVKLFVKGTVNGKVLVYSPEGVVIEGSLRYADDPRSNDDSDDYLGLVSDKNVSVARRYVTGRGDLSIDAAIFARRRFDVLDYDFGRGATIDSFGGRTALLSIYGSLTSGTISATEPRYATKIVFDPRFDRRRPPGFPATNRFEVAAAAEEWTEVEEPTSL